MTLRLPAEEAARASMLLTRGPLGGGTSVRSVASAGPHLGASALKGSGQRGSVSTTSNSSNPVHQKCRCLPLFPQGSVNLLHLIGVLFQLCSEEEAAPNWSSSDKVVRLGRQLTGVLNVVMSRMAGMSQRKTDSRGAWSWRMPLCSWEMIWRE